MKFSNLLLRVDGVQDASLEDCRRVAEIGAKTYNPEGQKFLYVIETEIVEDRFFWMSCEYDDAVRFRDYVINQETCEREPNPRRKSQIEPRLQLFACFDTQKHFLYINDSSKRTFLQKYMSDAIQKEFEIKNVYASVNEFCNRLKYIRGFTYTQVDNLYTRAGTIFQQVGDMWGRDLPNRVQLKISYGNIPVHRGREIIDRLSDHRNEFESIVILGCDDDGVEQAFDFSSILKRTEIQPHKDENEHFDSEEVKMLLLNELR